MQGKALKLAFQGVITPPRAISEHYMEGLGAVSAHTGCTGVSSHQHVCTSMYVHTCTACTPSRTHRNTCTVSHMHTYAHLQMHNTHVLACMHMDNKHAWVHMGACTRSHLAHAHTRASIHHSISTPASCTLTCRRACTRTHTCASSCGVFPVLGETQHREKRM